MGMGGGMAGGGAYGGGYGAGRAGAMAVGGNGGNCCVAQGEDCTACGVGCGGNGRFAGLRGRWPGRLHPGDYVQVCRLWWRFRSTPSRFYLPDYDVLSFELVAPDPTASVAVVRDSDFATIRLRIWLRTVGDHLVSSPTGVLLLDDGEGLHHSSPRDHSHRSTHTISNTPAHSAADSTTDSASHKTASTQRTSGSLQLRS